MRRLLLALAAVSALTLSSASSCGSSTQCVYNPSTHATVCQH